MHMYIMYIRTQVQEVCVKICFEFEYSRVDEGFFVLCFLLVSKYSLHGKKIPLNFTDSSRELRLGYQEYFLI